MQQAGLSPPGSEKQDEQASRGGGRSRWYFGYFLLALFNIVTISAGTMMNYKLVQQLEDSNEVNRYWSQSLSDYAELEALLSEANAPGNDVFASLAPRAEAMRLAETAEALQARFAAMHERHDAETDHARGSEWLAEMSRVEQESAKMIDQARQLLRLVEAGDMAGAGRSMAAMDRTYAEIVRVVNRLELEAQIEQRSSLREKFDLVARMRNTQYVIGGLIALLVFGVVAYGYRIALQMSRDEAERMAQLAALGTSEQRFRELTEGSIQGIVVHRDGVPLFVNDAWARIHGFEDIEAARATENISGLVLAEDRNSVRDIQYALQHGVGDSTRYEYRAGRPDGQTIWLECQERVVDWQGEPALQSTVIDATERKLAEEGLRSAILRAEQATNARTRFFAAASHDLRQPLHAISLYLPLLLKRMDSVENREMLVAIQNSCNAMRSLLDSLLDISRLDAGVIEPEVGPVSLLDVFDQLGMEFMPQARAAGLELRVVLADYWVRTDAALLERILRNLLTNAIRYTNSGKVLLGARRVRDTVRVEVWDTGIGIDEATREHIFEEFYQADNPERDRSRGLGLGLSIIRRLATLLDHKLGVRSWPGRGSVFDITLPIAEEPAVIAVQPRGDLSHSGVIDGRMALLIDDDPIVLEGTVAMLEDWGFNVVGVPSLPDAIESIRDQGVAPDLVLADLRLRGSETGLDAIAALTDLLGRQIPAIIVTGDTDPKRIRQASASGLTILHKPVEPAVLQSAVLAAMKDSEPPADASSTPRKATVR